jgi:hypothetical protein
MRAELMGLSYAKLTDTQAIEARLIQTAEELRQYMARKNEIAAKKLIRSIIDDAEPPKGLQERYKRLYISMTMLDAWKPNWKSEDRAKTLALAEKSASEDLADALKP